MISATKVGSLGLSPLFLGLEQYHDRCTRGGFASVSKIRGSFAPLRMTTKNGGYNDVDSALIGTLYPTWHTEVTKLGGAIELFAYGTFVWAAFRGTKKWLFLLLLSPVSYFLWLLAQGH
jgi:hypothetical protein